MKRIPFIIGAALLLSGWLYALLPHAYHGELSAGGIENEDHFVHSLFGISAALGGLAILVFDARRSTEVSAKRATARNEGLRAQPTPERTPASTRGA